MRASLGSAPLLHSDAVVQWVDSVNREVGALVAGILFTIYAPPGCPIVLRGETVKFRLLQPGDLVRVTYVETAGLLVAKRIEALGRSVTPQERRAAADRSGG
jgi:hypothetical protein